MLFRSKLWKNKPISLKNVLNFLEQNIKFEIINENINDSEINKNVKKNFREWTHSSLKKLKFNISEL